MKYRIKVCVIYIVFMILFFLVLGYLCNYVDDKTFTSVILVIKLC
jgi:hypothetical protein